MHPYITLLTSWIGDNCKRKMNIEEGEKRGEIKTRQELLLNNLLKFML